MIVFTVIGAPFFRTSLLLGGFGLFLGTLILPLMARGPTQTGQQTKVAKSEPERFLPPSEALEEVVVRAFSSTHDGWSADEILLRDKQREEFVSGCRFRCEETNPPIEFDYDRCCRALLHVRKAGGRLPAATRRATAVKSSSGPDARSADGLSIIAEIAARRLADEMSVHTDAILVSTVARKRFDELAMAIAPVNAYDARKAALRLRKTRRLQPELLSRVTDWRLSIEEYSAETVRSKLKELPIRPGIYVFRDVSGYIYIGQASDLRKRLSEHLHGSDRKALAAYLAGKQEAHVTVELHVFGKGSPGEELRVRRAYESEMIRVRKPRLNLAP